MQKTDVNYIGSRKEKKNVLSLDQVDKLYDDSNETNRIEIRDGFVDFTEHFKFHLYISYHMRDECDIEK